METRKRICAMTSLTLLVGATPWAGVQGGNRVIGAVAPNGGACLVKHFSVPGGAVVTGIEFTNNDARTVFPKIVLLQGPLEKISEGTVLAEVSNVRSIVDGRVRAVLPPIVVDSGRDLYVVVALPGSDGILGVGNGAGLAATQLQAPANSYFASGEDEYLGAMDVEYELDVLYQTAGKASAGGREERTETPVIAEVRAHPNPFNPSATIGLSVPQTAHVKAGIYDVAGRRIRMLVNQVLSAGVHERVWDGRDDSGQRVAAGIYVVKSTIGTEVRQQKIVLIK